MELWITLALLSAIVLGCRDIYAKKFLSQKTTPTQLLFIEYFILIFILLFFIPSISLSVFQDNILLFLLKGLFLITSSITYLYLLKRFDISLVSPLLNASPIFLLFLTPFILSERITFLQLVGILILISATYFLELVISRHDTEADSKKNYSLLFLLFSLLLLVTISLLAILDKLLLVRVSVTENLFFTALTTVSFLLIYKLIRKEVFQTLIVLKNKPSVILLGLMSNVSVFLVLAAISIPTALVSLVIPLRRTSTIISSIGGGLFFHEKHLFKKFLSVLVMIIGVILITL